MTPEEYKKRYNNKNEDPEKFAQESLAGSTTTEEIMEKMNAFGKIVGGKEIFKWIEYKGEKILFCDYTIQEEPRLSTLGTYHLYNLLMSIKKETKILALYHLTKISFTRETAEAMKKLKKAIIHHGANYRASIYGLSGLKKIIISYSQPDKKTTYYAKDKEEALEWLVQK